MQLGSPPKIMGILNVTPDSFSDGGDFVHLESALQRAQHMIHEGADIIDIGGESTRPGATPITLQEEIARVVPVIKALRQTHISIPISIDTRHAAVMRAALEAGASMINDVAALQAPGALEVAAQFQVPVCLMHMQNDPQNMQLNPVYENILEELYQFFEQRIAACEQAGILRKNIWIDPGFGFGKSMLEHNLTLLGNLSYFTALGCPILVGLSRKSMLGAILNAPVDQRLIGGVAAAVLAAVQGAHIIRTHDVTATKEALMVCNAVQPYWQRGEKACV